MKIAIPVSDKSIDADIYDSLGRAPYFIFYNVISNDYEFIDNKAVASQGGAGVRVAQVIADNGVRAVITKQCGGNAEKVFASSEVLIYQSIPGTLKENISAYTNNCLNLMQSFVENKNSDK